MSSGSNDAGSGANDKTDRRARARVRALGRGRLRPGWADFLGGWILGNDDDSLLLLADNYIQQIRNGPKRRRDKETF